MNGVHGGAGVLGGAVLALACVPLLARGPAAVRAAFAQAVLLALALAGRALEGAAWGELAGAVALLAAGAGMLRLLRPGGGDAAGGWGAVLAGLGLVVLGAAAGRQAALLQDAAMRDTLGLGLTVLLLGLLAASLRRDMATRAAAAASALHGVALAALGMPARGGVGAGTVALAVAALVALLAAGLAPRPAAAPTEPAADGIGHEA
ncbi:MAG: hypothetical protein ACRYGC_10915 [Janthinobacterium lividum]